MRRIPMLLGIVLAAVLVTADAPAHAAFPGKNGKIAFSRHSDIPFQAREIWTADPDGSNLTRLTDNLTTSEGDFFPAWSADGREIAFIRADRSGTGSGAFVYVMNADGTGATKLAATGYNALDPAWSPDGTKIAFSNAEGTQCGAMRISDCSTLTSGYRIYTIKADGTGLTRLAGIPGNEWEPAWSPDGSRIAFAGSDFDNDGHFAIYVMNADGTNLLKLTTPVSSADDESPNWSPDGRRIVFSSTRDFHNDNVWIVNADGGGVTRVTTNDSRGIYPVWSPDGSRIAFTSDRSQDAYSIYTIAPDGTGVSRVTSGGRFDLDPDWQPVPGPRRGDYRNAAEFCRAERSFLGDEAFAQEYGSNGSGANAYGRCVSQA